MLSIRDPWTWNLQRDLRAGATWGREREREREREGGWEKERGEDREREGESGQVGKLELQTQIGF